MEIGYAPDSFDKLSNFLENRGYNKTYIEKAGLAFLKTNGACVIDLDHV